MAQFPDIDKTAIRDARMIAKRWKNTLHKGVYPDAKGLKDYLNVINYPRGKHLGERKAAKRIRAVRDMIVRRGSYDDLTPVKKAQWTNLLEYNKIDCDGMRTLVIKCAKELAARRKR